jgi:hypothetical protein
MIYRVYSDNQTSLSGKSKKTEEGQIAKGPETAKKARRKVAQAAAGRPRDVAAK